MRRTPIAGMQRVAEGGKIYIYIYIYIYVFRVCATHPGRFTWFATRFTVAHYCATVRPIQLPSRLASYGILSRFQSETLGH